MNRARPRTNRGYVARRCNLILCPIPNPPPQLPHAHVREALDLPRSALPVMHLMMDGADAAQRQGWQAQGEALTIVARVTIASFSPRRSTRRELAFNR